MKINLIKLQQMNKNKNKFKNFKKNLLYNTIKLYNWIKQIVGFE